MKKVFYYAAAAALLPLAACGGKQAQEADTTVIVVSDTEQVSEHAADTEAIEEEAEEENSFAEQERIVREFYKKAVFGAPASAATIKKYCTSSFAAKLKAANEYDDGGYATWVLRTENQDGDGPSKVTSVTADGEDAVKVSYLDMGQNGTTRILFVKEGDTWKINGATKASGKKIL